MKQVITRTTRWALILALTATLWISSTSEAVAVEPEFDEEIASLETGPIVRRQLLHRSARLELQPMAAFSVNDAFLRNVLPGISISYFLNNVFGLGVTGNFGVLQLGTSLRSRMAETLTDDQLRDVSYSKFNWTMDAALIYVPAFGKFSIMNSFFTHYDFHLMGGMAVIAEGMDPALESVDAENGMGDIRPGGMFGAGLRFFLGDMISLNLQMRNYVTTRVEISSGAPSPQLGNTVILSAGVGIFLPGEVRIAR